MSATPTPGNRAGLLSAHFSAKVVARLGRHFLGKQRQRHDLHAVRAEPRRNLFQLVTLCVATTRLVGFFIPGRIAFAFLRCGFFPIVWRNHGVKLGSAAACLSTSMPMPVLAKFSSSSSSAGVKGLPSAVP